MHVYIVIRGEMNEGYSILKVFRYKTNAVRFRRKYIKENTTSLTDVDYIDIIHERVNTTK